MTQSNVPHDVEVLLRQLNQDFMGWYDTPRRLLRALEGDELVLYAQPILALRGEQAFPMAEVLVRLQDETAVFLPPGGFLPLFEHFGLMPRLDLWVARQAVARLERSPRVSCLCINIATPTLGDPEFIPELASALERSKVKPASLVIEVSERDVIERPDRVGAFFDSLRAIGARVAIEGYGGRSITLTPLTTLRPDFVKIDGLIVRSLGLGLSAGKKLGAVVSIAKAVGFSLIGAGVEMRDTLSHLREAGVDYAQGYGIQVPAPISLIIDH